MKFALALLSAGIAEGISMQQIANYWISKHGKDNCQTATAVAMAESSGDCSARHVNSGGTVDRGLWQINDYYHPECSDSCAYDCGCNAGCAVQVWQSSGWSAWSTYKSGAHKQYLNDAAKACGYSEDALEVVPLQGFTCESACEFSVGIMKQLINKEGCVAASVEGAAACEAAGLGPEDPFADICAVIAGEACSHIADHMEESNSKICHDLGLCGGALESSVSVGYSPSAAVSWADSHCASDDGTECAEFVSNALKAGGHANGCFYPYVPDLDNCLKNNAGWKQTSFPCSKGSVVIWYDSQGPYHTALSRGDGTIDQHNPSRCGTSGSWGSNYCLTPPSFTEDAVVAANATVEAAPLQGFTCESACEFSVGIMKQLINKEGCVAASVEGAAACEAAGLGPEDPFADICAVIAGEACSHIADHMEESNSKICHDLGLCGGASVVV